MNEAMQKDLAISIADMEAGRVHKNGCFIKIVYKHKNR